MSIGIEGAERWFEDYRQGAVHRFGSIMVEERELLDFAKRFDPQSIHTDPDKAAAGLFKGLIASGWHTGGLMMNLYARYYLSECSSIASPGIDELRWPAPVRPGDQLSVRVTIEEARPSASKPDRGLVRTLIEVLNQRDEIVMSMRAMNMILRKPNP
ncbi:MaoC domain-containing protein dehydratase [Rhodospirillaceae bacterium LM-1]|nr:MaoC domain-containing protein dehydratase [Rhodospirillaceae bacterium LM-1]